MTTTRPIAAGKVGVGGRHHPAVDPEAAGEPLQRPHARDSAACRNGAEERNAAAGVEDVQLAGVSVKGSDLQGRRPVGADQPNPNDRASRGSRHRLGVGPADPAHRHRDLPPVAPAAGERGVPGRHHLFRRGSRQLVWVGNGLRGNQLFQIVTTGQGSPTEAPAEVPMTASATKARCGREHDDDHREGHRGGPVRGQR